MGSYQQVIRSSTRQPKPTRMMIRWILLLGLIAKVEFSSSGIAKAPSIKKSETNYGANNEAIQANLMSPNPADQPVLPIYAKREIAEPELESGMMDITDEMVIESSTGIEKRALFISLTLTSTSTDT